MGFVRCKTYLLFSVICKLCYIFPSDKTSWLGVSETTSGDYSYPWFKAGENAFDIWCEIPTAITGIEDQK